jgi:uncharacterized protein YbjT (DUF2867 family)
MNAPPVILLTGATGYVGGRLLRALEASGRRVRCMARRPENLRVWIGSGTEVVRGDCLERASLDGALAGVEAAYYLVHSMGAGADFEERDRRCARHFGEAARAAGVKRIHYLGGLGDGDGGAELSAHLRSRQETGEMLRAASGLPVIELRASIVLGAGSLSFELIRSLVERLPVMLCPRWVETEAQPIAIDDLVAYLLAALDLPAESRILEVGGADRVSYGDIMREYARQRGLRRVMIPVPVLTPRLSSLWLGLTTPLYARVGRKLIEGVRNPTVVRDHAAQRAFPSIRPIGLRDAISRAMANEDRTLARWSAALSSSGIDSKVVGSQHFGPRLIDSRVEHVVATAEQAFAPIRQIGGERGWYYADFLWRLRGFLDLLAGGVGLRRGRRDPESLAVGDALDFWRVEAYEPDRRLRLSAEMRLPGRAWLEFEVRPSGGETMIRQTAEFDPIGVAGRLYWYGIYPLHALVFRGMLHGIAARAAAHRRTPAPAPGRP